ncbi:MAG: RNase adapter RapZ, partial [Rhodospirillales bacterium]|nr:RNase adapter RapZ [Rhodospirillales bacterium]
MTTESKKPEARALLVTGMSGAGKTSALKALEDMNFEAVDNMPLSLLHNLVLRRQPHFSEDGFARPIAIGVDVRT